MRERERRERWGERERGGEGSFFGFAFESKKEGGEREIRVGR